MIRLLLFTGALALAIPAAPAIADDTPAEAKAKAKAAAKEAAKEAKEKSKAEQVQERIERQPPGLEKNAQKLDAKLDALGDKVENAIKHGGRALTVEAEKEKHQERLERLAKAEALAKEKNRADLLAKVTELRAKENTRHDRALARIAKVKK